MPRLRSVTAPMAAPVGEDGPAVVDGLRPVETLDVPLLDRALPEGTYELAAVERPCAGNCGQLDPAVDATRCDVDLTVKADRTTRVSIVLSSASGRPAADCSATTGR